MRTGISSDSLPIRAYGKFACAASNLQSFVLLLLRLTWGWELAESGYGHLTNIADTVKNFERWGVPSPVFNVYVSGTTELVGGTLLLLGLATRLISVPLVFNFIVAIIAAGRHGIAKAFAEDGVLAGWDKIIDDSAFPMLMLALIMLAFGPGKVSVDYLLKRTLFRKLGPDSHPGGFPVSETK
ncbi:MAG: DoxX family protein [Phycisphaerales bacterium]|nr:DoxX family protein [Phycisphaerales bacterium]MDB5357219.1 DoxX family protein [Phycisphaerales bacterium]